MYAFVAWWCAGLAAGAEPVVTPALTFQISFDESADAEVAGAIEDLRRGAFEAAARRLSALADAGGGTEIRTLQVAALYEAGELRMAEAAVAQGLGEAPTHAPLLALRGLVLADLGRGTDALASLDAARDRAGADRGLRARTELNRALVHLDRGEPAEAEAALQRARPLADRDEGLLARIGEMEAQVQALRGQSSPDVLGQVGQRLAAGDLAGARAALGGEPQDRRSRLRRAIAEGAIARAEGRFDAAATALRSAATEAGAHGLLREVAAAEAQLALSLGASNRPELGLELMQRAIDRIAGSSFRVAERSYRIEAGRLALRAGDTTTAGRQLASAQALPAEDPVAVAQLVELRGELAGAKGDASGAASALAEAAAAFEAHGAWMDAARVWTEAVTLAARTGDAAGLRKATGRAEAAFGRAADPLGPAHVAVARGLGYHLGGQVEESLRAFGAAIEAAGRAGSRGERIAQIAKENAAKVVAQSTGNASILDQAEKLGIDALVDRARTYLTSRAAYDEALTAYRAGRYTEALAGFERSVQGFESIGEDAHARVARRSRAWARFNANASADATTGYPIWQDLVEEGSMLQDAELRVRAMGAVALAAAELGRPEAARSLAAAASEAEAMGLRPLAGQCFGELVEVAGTLQEKVSAARRAFALREGDSVGTYALYSAAVAAYEAEAYDTAIELARQAEPMADAKLAPAVQQVLDAATASR